MAIEAANERDRQRNNDLDIARNVSKLTPLLINI